MIRNENYSQEFVSQNPQAVADARIADVAMFCDYDFSVTEEQENQAMWAWIFTEPASKIEEIIQARTSA